MLPIDQQTCRTARLARDPRFDGRFFVGVISTGIFCRPICPAIAPKEKNVLYYPSAVAAASAGFRPCLRCRPDSAPDSEEWLGNQATLKSAIKLIKQGFLTDQSLPQLANHLQVTDRYLRKLFRIYIGVSPLQFLRHQNCLFAKKLLHETPLAVHEVAFASGFNSIRSFNSAFKAICGKAPSEFRRLNSTNSDFIDLSLDFRPPFNWPVLIDFLKPRCIPGLEWVDGNSYGRTIQYNATRGMFTLQPIEGANQLKLSLKLNQLDDLLAIVERIKQCFDLAANCEFIAKHLSKVMSSTFVTLGLRIPLVWSPFEAGIRAICGQQISVKAAHNLVSKIVENLGIYEEGRFTFPTPEAFKNNELDFIKMPGKRKATIKAFANWWLTSSGQPLDDLLTVSGIGPWTLDYIKLRGVGDTDVWLDSDLGVKQALAKLDTTINAEMAKPYRSYLTFQLWQLLA